MYKRLSLLIFFFCFISFSQNEVLDSLVNHASQLSSDSLKIDQLHKDFFKYVYSRPDVARTISDFTVNQTSEEKSAFLHTQALIRKGIYYDVTSKKDSALLLYDQAYAIAAPRKDFISMGNVYNDKGLVYWNRDELERAMQQFIKGANAFEQVKNENGLASIYNNIGLILYDLGRYEESTASHHKALKIRLKIKDTYGLGASYSNLSNSLKREQKLDSSMFYMKKAIETKRESNDKRGLAIAYQNLGVDFRESRELDSALFYTKKAKLLYEEIGNKRLLANNLVTIAEMYMLSGKYDDGLASIQSGINLIDNNEYKRLAEMEVISAKLLAYKNNHKESAKAYARAIEYRDSYEETQRTAQAQEYYEKYQAAQKEQEIAEQRARIAERDLDIEKRNKTIAILMGIAILILMLGILLYRHQQLKNKQKAKESELQLAIAKIETQNKLQEQRLRISRDLHDNIGSQLTFLISSLDNLKYAKNVDQVTANNSLENLSDFTRNTMGELRDTIWAMNKKEISLKDIEERSTSMISRLNTVLSLNQSIEVDFDIRNEYIFSTVYGMHIFRIIQESVNNAIKYSGASLIILKIESQNSHLIITITDNGKGFDLNNYEPGNGIKNIKERARLINSKVVFDSSDEGTSIQLFIPV
ncbi:MAG: tetratricopeptide repeat-containing sensor histidine kinase [Nonlabens sp.]|uniref:tetratricopeptide repeat-containing sensor histidine kinase n=1 Tax=Nonlabens sp. TaxID=1888209 RepID=UPI003EF44874